jgi:hypothetical protein
MITKFGRVSVESLEKKKMSGWMIIGGRLNLIIDDKCGMVTEIQVSRKQAKKMLALFDEADEEVTTEAEIARR